MFFKYDTDYPPTVPEWVPFSMVARKCGHLNHQNKMLGLIFRPSHYEGNQVPIVKRHRSEFPGSINCPEPKSQSMFNSLTHGMHKINSFPFADETHWKKPGLTLHPSNIFKQPAVISVVVIGKVNHSTLVPVFVSFHQEVQGSVPLRSALNPIFAL